MRRARAGMAVPGRALLPMDEGYRRPKHTTNREFAWYLVAVAAAVSLMAVVYWMAGGLA